MRRVALGRPNNLSDPKSFQKWVTDCFAEIERAATEDTSTIASDFSPTGHTRTHALDAATATTADIANVLCTLLEDLQNGGMKRSQ